MSETGLQMRRVVPPPCHSPDPYLGSIDRDGGSDPETGGGTGVRERGDYPIILV